MMIFIACGMLLLQGASLPRELSLDEPQTTAQQEQDPFPPPEGPASKRDPAIVDLDWLELAPGAGIVFFSSKFRADPAPCVSLRAHAPMPWLNPAGDAIGDYFGVFVEADVAPMERKLSPTVSHRRGVASLFSVGADYSFLRDGAWILLARAGLMYAYYGGIADLKSGFGPMIGGTAGYQISGKLALTYSPEVLLGKPGSAVFLNTIGLLVQF